MPTLLNSKGKPGLLLLTLCEVFGIKHDGTARGISAVLQELWLQPAKPRIKVEERHAHYRMRAMPLLRDLRMVQPIDAPAGAHYNYALLMGETLPEVRRRLAFLVVQYARDVSFDRVVALGSNRPLNKDTENIEAILTPTDITFREGWKMTEAYPRTEAQMMRIVLEQSNIPESWVVDPVICAQDRKATTRDTIVELRERRPIRGSCLVVSSQPFVHYQTMVAGKELPNGCSVSGCGPMAQDDLPLGTYLDTVAKQLYEELEIL